MKRVRTTLDYARWYVSKGFSVIPLNPRSKFPAAEALPVKLDDRGNPILYNDGKLKHEWEPYQKRIATDEELISWFGNNSKRNIAIVTGKISGIAGVDLDSERAVEFAKANNFPPTPVSKTGKQGYHHIFRYKEGTRNFQTRDDLPGIDLRGDGGYIVAPPSVHPETGKQYQWVEGKGLNDLPLAELPEIILAKGIEDKKPLRELYKGVPDGRRNDSLTRLVGSWVNDGLSFDECLSLAFVCNERNTPPEADLRKIERTVKSIFDKHHRELSYCPPPI